MKDEWRRRCCKADFRLEAQPGRPKTGRQRGEVVLQRIPLEQNELREAHPKPSGQVLIELDSRDSNAPGQQG